MDTRSMLNNIEAQGMMDKIGAAEGILNASLAIKLSDKFYMNGACVCSDNEKAGLLQDAIKGAISAAKLSVSHSRDTIDILNRIEVTTDDNNVIIDAEMQNEDIEQLMKHRDKVVSI